MSPLTRLRIGLLSCLALLGVMEPAAAHGILLEARPQAGSTVAQTQRLDLRFNSRIEPAFSKLRLEGQAGVSMPLHAVMSESPGSDRLSAPVPPLPPGPYTVYWRVLTVDGHVSHGRFSFRIAEGDRDH